MKRKNDGLNKWQRYRLKDIDAYRTRKAVYGRTAAERAKRTAYMRVWREKNREKHNRLARESHQRNKNKHCDKRRNYELLKKFGIGLLEKDSMVKAQQGKCWICMEPFRSTRSTHVDHCHETGAIRGILCHVCNTKLSWFERHRSSIVRYLER